jgi:predicted Zn-dependent protease with MMP-like domain
LLGRGLPGARSRAQRFDDQVSLALSHLNRRWERQLKRIQVAVEDVPPSEPAPWEHGVALGRTFPAGNGLPPRIVLYRRPIEERLAGPGDLPAAVYDVLVEQLAHLLGRRPEEIDPGRD